MNNFPIGDFLIRIKNAYLASRKTVLIPWSLPKEEIAKLLTKYGFIAGVKKEKAEKNRYFLKIGLFSRKKLPSLEIELFSKPGRRFYAGVKDLPYPERKGALIIISTSEGIMSGSQAKKKNLGGEVIAHLS